MAELYPASLGTLLTRIHRELSAQDSLFDLKSKHFYRGDAGLDTSIRFLGRPAATPVGPAAGPQSQLAQNIVLAWLAGARVVELKTVQINDRLQIPRPCISAGNVGYNVEWSQELRLADSLREYVKASMILDLLRTAGTLGPRPAEDKHATVFDMSVGYDLKGIQSPEVTGWIRSLLDANAIVDEQRAHIPTEWAHFRDHPFATRVADTLTLSTFHGCPADEIEKIVRYLVFDLGIDTVIKLNPTLLGKPRVDHLLHEILGYTDILTPQDAFDKDLQFADALDMVRRLAADAAKVGRTVGVKFTNTLVVENRGKVFSEPVMYLSGPPLHVISLTLAEVFRQALGFDLPVSFSAGIDRTNFTDAVACGFTPITTCTDLLKTGGYGRLSGYLCELERRMKAAGVRNVQDFILKAEGEGKRALQSCVDELARWLGPEQGRAATKDAVAAKSVVETLKNRLCEALDSASVNLTGPLEDARAALEPLVPAEAWRDSVQPALQSLRDRAARQASLANMRPIVARTQADPRYRKALNTALPRKIGSRLHLFDCINCDKCIPVCPNDANFSYEVGPVEAQYRNLRVGPEGVEEVGIFTFRLEKAHQIANFSDFCNECGNCDTFCPEDGGPYIVKPRFFGSLEAWRRHADRDGFYVADTATSAQRMYGRIDGREYLLELEPGAGLARFSDDTLGVTVALAEGKVSETRVAPGAQAGHQLDMSRYHIMKAVLEGVTDPRRVNYVNSAVAPARG
ncbi:MAG: glutamate synthase [Candidatus Wallbacteria bacterium]|nr:glutamate synthase [Candidatus Wallbacteria bacterium]